jgi:hypothetical protein
MRCFCGLRSDKARERRGGNGRDYQADDPAPMCGRYVTPDEAAMERTYNLTARQWESWMDRAYWPS